MRQLKQQWLADMHSEPMYEASSMLLNFASDAGVMYQQHKVTACTAAQQHVEHLPARHPAVLKMHS